MHVTRNSIFISNIKEVKTKNHQIYGILPTIYSNEELHSNVHGIYDFGYHGIDNTECKKVQKLKRCKWFLQDDNREGEKRHFKILWRGAWNFWIAINFSRFDRWRE